MMLRCPFCDADLGTASSRLRGGRCPQCGSLLDWTENPEPNAPPAGPPANEGSLQGAGLGAGRPSAKPSIPPPVSTDDDDGGMSMRDIVRTIVSRAPTVPPASRKTVVDRHARTVSEMPALDADAAPAASPPPDVSVSEEATAADPVTDGAEEKAVADDAVAGGGIAAGGELPVRSGGTVDLEDYQSGMEDIWRGAADTAQRPSMTLKSSSHTPDIAVTDLLIRPFQIGRLGELSQPGNEYELQEVIGEGGVGIVYAARQASIDRIVALKMLHAEYAHKSDHRNKFLSEAVVTGELDHPNIVPIYDLGTSNEGSLFYAMKRVRGTPWSDVIGRQSLSENLRILLSVADAIAFAHSRGVIHRDLKPENVMLGDFGEVLVMDWGIALSTSLFVKSNHISKTTSMGGSPAYMAPEMATGPLSAIGPASDVYLLGAILYEIVTGRPPHTGQDVMSCLYAAARNEIQPTDKSGELMDIAMKAMATRPADRYASVQDFQAAVREYQSHSESVILSNRAEDELAQARHSGEYQDYARALFAFQEAYSLWRGNDRAATGENEARLAYAQRALEKEDFDLGISLLDERRPDHVSLHRQLLTARHERDARQARIRGLRQLATALAALVILTLSGGLFFISRQYVRIGELNREQEITIRDLDNAQKTLAQQRDDLENANKSLEKTTRNLANSNFALVSARKSALAEAETARRAEQEAAAASYRAQIGVAAEQIASNSFNDAERLLDDYQDASSRWSYFRHWEWGHLKYLCSREAGQLAVGPRIESLARSAEGRHLAVGTATGKALVFEIDWQAQALRPLGELEQGGAVGAIALSTDGTRVAVAGDFDNGQISLYRLAATGDRYEKESLVLAGHAAGTLSLAFSPSGKLLASSSRQGPAHIWNSQSGELTQHLAGHFGPVWSVAFTPDEQYVVTSGDDATVRIWKVGANESRIYRGHQEPVYSVAVSPRGDWIASGGGDRVVHIWRADKDLRVDYTAIERDLERQRRTKVALPRTPFHSPDYTLAGHTADVRALAFSHDGTKVLSGGNDNTVRRWSFQADASQPEYVTTFRGHGGWISGCVLSPDGRYAASGSLDGFIKLWDADEYEEVRTLRGHEDAVLWAAFSRSGQHMVTAGRDRRALLWSAESRLPLHVFDEGEPIPAMGTPGGLAARLREGHAFLATSAVFFADGQRLLTSAGDGTVRLWDVAGGGQLRRFSGTGTLGALALSPDGAWVITGSDSSDKKDDQAALLWAVDDERSPPIRLGGHRGEVCAVAFSPHRDLGQLRIATGDMAGSVRLWRFDAAEGSWRSDVRLHGHQGGHGITAIRFTPDGRRVLSASHDHTVLVHDAATGERQSLVLRHPEGVKGLALAHDGMRALTFCSEGREAYRVILWNLETGDQRSCVISRRNEALTSVEFHPNQSSAVLTTTSGDESRLWRWDFAATEPRPMWPAHVLRGTVWSTTFSPNGSRLVAVGGSQARLLMSQDGKTEKTFSSHGPVTSANFSNQGDLIATSGLDGDVKLWFADPSHPLFGRVAFKLPHPHAVEDRWYPVNFVAFSPRESDGAATLVTAGADGTARLWLWAGGALSHQRTLRGHTATVHSALFSPNGQWVLTSSADGTARLWDAESGSPADPTGRGLVHPESVLFAAFAPDGQHVITGCDDNCAYVWDVSDPANPRQQWRLQGHTAAVACAAISADGRRAITGSKDGIAKLWDLQSGREALSLKRHTAELTSVHFSPDGNRILTSSHDQTALVWPATKIGPAVRLSSARLEIPREAGLHAIDPLAQIFDPDAPELEGGLLEVWLSPAPQELTPLESLESAEEPAATAGKVIALSLVTAADLWIENGEVMLRRGDETLPVARIREATSRQTGIELELLPGASTQDAQRLLAAIGVETTGPIDTPQLVHARIVDGQGRISPTVQATLRSKDESEAQTLATARK